MESAATNCDWQIDALDVAFLDEDFSALVADHSDFVLRDKLAPPEPLDDVVQVRCHRAGAVVWRGCWERVWRSTHKQNRMSKNVKKGGGGVTPKEPFRSLTQPGTEMNCERVRAKKCIARSICFFDAEKRHNAAIAKSSR